MSNLWYCMSWAGKRGRRSSAGSLDSNMEVSRMPSWMWYAFDTFPFTWTLLCSSVFCLPQILHAWDSHSVSSKRDKTTFYYSVGTRLLLVALCNTPTGSLWHVSTTHDCLLPPHSGSVPLSWLLTLSLHYLILLTKLLTVLCLYVSLMMFIINLLVKHLYLPRGRDCS